MKGHWNFDYLKTSQSYENNHRAMHQPPDVLRNSYTISFPHDSDRERDRFDCFVYISIILYVSFPRFLFARRVGLFALFALNVDEKTRENLFSFLLMKNL